MTDVPKTSADPENTMSLALAPQPGEIARVTGAVEVFGEKLRFPAAALYQVTLVLDELITNILSYGLEAGESRPIIVELSYADERLTIVVSDPGRPFDPRNVPPPDLETSLEDRKVGGLGVHFARTMMDSFDYHYADGRNHVTLMKQVGKAGR